MIKIILTTISILLISGCSSKELQVDKIVELKHPECQEIPDFQGKTMGDLYESYIELAKLYQQCSNLNKDSQ